MPPTPTMGNHSPLPNFNQINLAPISGFSLSPSRNKDLPLIPTPPLAIGPFPMLPPTTPKVLAPLQSPQIPLRGVANKHDIAAMPTIPAIGPTSRHMSLTPKADATVPAGPTLNPDLRLVIHQLLQGSGALVAICATNAPLEENLESMKSAGCPSWGAASSFSHRPLSESDGAPGEKASAPGGAPGAPPLSPTSPEEPRSSGPYEPI